MKKIYTLLTGLCLSLSAFAANEVLIANFEGGSDGFALGWGSGTALVVDNPSTLGAQDPVNTSAKVMHFTSSAWTGLSKWYDNADAFKSNYTKIEFDVYVPTLKHYDATDTEPAKDKAFVKVMGASSLASADNSVNYGKGNDVTVANTWVHFSLDITDNTVFDFRQFYFQSEVGEFYVDNIVAISNTAVNSILFSSAPPTTVHQGEEVSFDIVYNVAQASKIKAGIVNYNGYTWIADLKAAYIDEAAATTSKVVKTVTLTIPSDATLSAALAAGTYKWEISISNTDWAYLAGLKTDVALTTATPIDYNETLKTNIFSTSGAINVAGSEGSTVEVYSLTGTKVSAEANISSSYSVNVPVGMYIVSVDGKTTKVMVK